MKGGLMKRIGKALLSGMLLFTNLTAVSAEEEIELTEETEEVTENTEEEQTPSEETAEAEEEVTEETAEEEEVIEETEETEETEEEVPAEEATEEETVEEEVSEEAEALDATGKKAFVGNLYKNILNRSGSSSEIAYYVGLLNKNTTAAKVISGFVESSEYQKKYPGDRQYVIDMYETLLKRTPSAKEITSWTSRMNVGQTYRIVLAGLINSGEFQNICAKDGITAGSYTSPKAVDQNLKITTFVSGLYTKALGRKADVQGLEDWTGKLLKGMTGAKLIDNVINSAEYENRKLSTEKYIKNLYEVLLSRGASDKEVNYWKEHLSAGQTRKAILMGLVNSKEFENKCSASGIKRGTYSSPNAVDQNYEITKYVGSLYQNCFGRTADAGGLETWTNKIISGQKTAAGAVLGFFNSTELTKKKLTNKAYVTTAYKAILNRTASSKEISDWVAYLNSGKSRNSMLIVFFKSAEFGNLCTGKGMRAYTNADISFRVQGPAYNPFGGGFGSCTSGAWDLALRYAGVRLPNWGYASNWYAAAARDGYPVGRTPRVNSIAVYYGHVAFVAQVSPDGTRVYIKEGGFNGHYMERWVSAWGTGTKSLIGYIYL